MFEEYKTLPVRDLITSIFEVPMDSILKKQFVIVLSAFICMISSIYF